MALLESKNIKWLVLGGIAAAGAWYYFRGRGLLAPGAGSAAMPPGGSGAGPGPMPGSVFPGKPPAPVKKNELVKALTYQIVTGARASGFKYYAAKKLASGEIQFRSLVPGMFTRNVLQEGKKLWAEVQPAVNPMLAGIMGW
jgi:hypothetical protein